MKQSKMYSYLFDDNDSITKTLKNQMISKIYYKWLHDAYRIENVSKILEIHTMFSQKLSSNPFDVKRHIWDDKTKSCAYGMYNFL